VEVAVAGLARSVCYWRASVVIAPPFLMCLITDGAGLSLTVSRPCPPLSSLSSSSLSSLLPPPSSPSLLSLLSHPLVSSLSSLVSVGI
jgi:hypothetical protein